MLTGASPSTGITSQFTISGDFNNCFNIAFLGLSTPHYHLIASQPVNEPASTSCCGVSFLEPLTVPTISGWIPRKQTLRWGLHAKHSLRMVLRMDTCNKMKKAEMWEGEARTQGTCTWGCILPCGRSRAEMALQSSPKCRQGSRSLNLHRGLSLAVVCLTERAKAIPSERVQCRLLGQQSDIRGKADGIQISSAH